MDSFFLIGLCILTGYGLRRFNVLPEGSHRSINIWLIYMAVPAIALKYIPAIKWSTEVLFPATMPILIWVCAWLVFYLYARIRPIDIGTRAALTLTAGIGNTSFLGYPLVQCYYGAPGLPTAVIFDQSSLIILYTAGAAMAMRASATGSVSVAKLVRQLFIFPPFTAFIVALIAPLLVDMSPLMPLLDKVVATLVPMALFSVGLQLNFSGWREELSPLSMALSYKLLIAPALIFILMLAWKLKGLMPEITVFQGSMAPRITSGVVAAHYSLNPRLANLIIGIGILLSFLTTAIWWLVMNQMN